jgi:Core-2/I-Branching enzyme
VSDLAVVTIAHTDPTHLARLVGALEDLPVFLHCDAKTSTPVFEQMVGSLPRRVTVLPRMRTSISSWSLVEAELRALRAAITSTSAEHVAVLSGTDYPLVPVEELLDVLRPWHGSSYFYNVPLPFPQWNTRRHADGGEWRLRHHFATWRGHIVSIAGFPLYWPLRRELPPGLCLRASSEWKILAREHVKMLLRVVESRPELIRFWRSTFVPDESFVASILASPAIVGSDALPPCGANAWHYEFARGAHHPKVLTSLDFDVLAAARRGPAVKPSEALADPALPAPAHRKLFARKFSSAGGGELLDRIDAELRGIRTHP